jgi:Ca2+/Na+ antiporter
VIFFVDLLFALALALLVTIIVAPARRYEGDWAFVLVFFLLLVLIWAGGAWLTPIGTPMAGVYWLNFVIVALFLLFLVLALAPPPREKRRVDPIERDAERTAAGTVIAFGIFFWVLLVLALVAVALYYA